MTYWEAMKEAAGILEAQGVPDAELDAKYLLFSAADMEYSDWFFRRTDKMPEHQLAAYRKMTARRAKREPLQQILGCQEFMGLTFQVTKDVLVPRQDTEHLVTLAMPLCKGKKVLDLCTGSGCIAISLAKLAEPSEVLAVDLSLPALAVAAENAEKLQAPVAFRQSDMYAEVTETFDVVVSNPPYIPPEQMRELMPEVLKYEPEMALYGGEDGLDFYRILAEETPRHLKSGGSLLVEIGYDQGERVKALFEKAGFLEVRVHQDYAGLDRVVTGHL